MTGENLRNMGKINTNATLPTKHPTQNESNRRLRRHAQILTKYDSLGKRLRNISNKCYQLVSKHVLKCFLLYHDHFLQRAAEVQKV